MGMPDLQGYTWNLYLIKIHFFFKQEMPESIKIKKNILKKLKHI